MRKELATNAALCTVCRACVIACHFHHTRLFGTTKSSVHIIYDADTADLVLQIDDTCDLCAGESQCFCVQACVPAAITLQENE
jgi:Fe-S-cluster-containing hydrogenase component 2